MTVPYPEMVKDAPLMVHDVPSGTVMLWDVLPPYVILPCVPRLNWMVCSETTPMIVKELYDVVPAKLVTVHVMVPALEMVPDSVLAVPPLVVHERP